VEYWEGELASGVMRGQERCPVGVGAFDLGLWIQRDILERT
jgi:hypothetical protein